MRNGCQKGTWAMSQSLSSRVILLITFQHSAVISAVNIVLLRQGLLAHHGLTGLPLS